MATRAAFLSNESHRIRFVYIPKHTSKAQSDRVLVLDFGASAAQTQ